jgi:hypothetical protein
MSKITKAIKGGSLASDAVLSVMKGNKCDVQPNKIQIDMTAGFNENNVPFNLSTIPFDNKGFIQIAAGRQPFRKNKSKNSKKKKTVKGGMYANSIHELQSPYFIGSDNSMRTNEGASSVFGATVPKNGLHEISDIFNGEKSLFKENSLPNDLRFGDFSVNSFKAPTLSDSLVNVDGLDGSVTKASVYPQSPTSELTLDNFSLPANFIGGSRKNKKSSGKKKTRRSNSPKNKNPYILFCKKQRETLKKTGLSSKEIMKKCGELWRAQKK